MNPYQSFPCVDEKRSQMNNRQWLAVAAAVVLTFAVADMSYFWLHASEYALLVFQKMIGM